MGRWPRGRKHTTALIFLAGRVGPKVTSTHATIRALTTTYSGARLCHIDTRGAGRGARGVFIFFDCLLFFVLVPNCPRLAGRPCQGLAIDLE